MMDLEAISNYMNSLPPMPVAVWVIDRPEVYFKVKDLIKQAEAKDIEGSSYQFAMGMPVYGWDLEELIQHIQKLREEGMSEEHLIDTYPFRARGVYVQMNKGNHIILDI